MRFTKRSILPEALVTGREDIYLGWFYRTYGARPDAIGGRISPSICGCIGSPGRCGRGFRTTARSRGISPTMPPRWLGSNCRCRCWRWVGTGRGAGGMEVVESLRRMAVDVQGGVVENCGHWMPEEQPDELLRRLLEFFGPDN